VTELTSRRPLITGPHTPENTGLFGRIGSLAARRSRAVLLVSLLVFLVGAGLGATAFGKLKTGGFTDPSSASDKATQLLDDRFGGAADVVLLVHASSGTVDDPAVAEVGNHAAALLGAVPGVTHVESYWQTHDPALRSTDRQDALVVGTQRSDTTISPAALASLRLHTPRAEISIGGDSAVNNDVTTSVGNSLALAEAIAVPIVLLLLVFAFGSIVSALLPLAVGAVAIMGTFAELSILGSITDVAIYAINLTTAMGMALGIDYALLMVSRFREELAGGATTEQAVRRAVSTAGRTIVFSGATVIAALAALLMFPLYFLRSFAYAGIGVVVIAAAAALFVLPALLMVVGPRVNAGRLPWARKPPSTVAPWWGRLAAFAWRRPVLAAVPVIGVLSLIASPLLHASVGTPDDRVLRTGAESRQVGDVLRTHFAGDTSTALQLATTGPVGGTALADYAKRLSTLPEVTRVQASTGDYTDGTAVGTDPADAALAASTAQRLTVITRADPRSARAQELVGTIRDTAAPAGTSVLVGGQTAELMDTKHAIGVRLAIAAAWIAVTTFLVLFLFTGSVVQPIRSLLLNLLTLTATLGLMVWIFQDGHLSGALHFTPLPLDTSMLVLLFCISYGLSMDYEVFVLSRIKEQHDAGSPDAEAVVSGLTRTGRIVTTAAALMAVSYLAFGVSSVSFLQLFGLGAGFAVLVDATLVRGVLVPAAMRGLGRAAWYAPPPLRRLYRRISLTDA
jgi:putative drug exporter of the RND superfamily